MSIYVETKICGDMDELWRLTQTPDLHARWDLRFTEIESLPRPSDAEPQQFLYTTRIGFGWAVRGQGETVGQRDGADGQRTSALKFWSDDPKSLIRDGTGYWQYVPTGDGLRFLTSYDYRVRFGRLGRAFDRVVFRPLLGWATAWSFDRLRLWMEKGIDPAISLERSLVHLIARLGVAFVWAYQGVVPKLIFHHTDEVAMLEEAGISTATASNGVQLAGWMELCFGIAILFLFHHRWPLVLTVILMVGALIGVAVSSPQYLIAAFNPVSLNVLMIALALVGLVANKELPSASRCLRKPPTGRA